MTPNNEDRLIDRFDECCERMRAGESLSVILAAYPLDAPALEPMLLTVVGVRPAIPVYRRPEAAAQSRAAFLAAAATTAPRASVAPMPSMGASIATWWAEVVAGFRTLQPMPIRMMATLIVVVLAGVLTTGAFTASANSLPGDPLYPLKTVTEQARVVVARDLQAREAVLAQIEQERASEAKAVARLQRPVPRLELFGTLEAMGPDRWLVAGVSIIVDERTVVRGEPAGGDKVHVVLTAPGDGSLVALSLAVVKPSLRLDNPTPTTTPTAAPAATATSSATATHLPSPTSSATARSARTDLALKIANEPDMPPRGTREASPTFTATPLPLLAATSTVSPTMTATIVPTAAPTATAVPLKAVVRVRMYGWVVAVAGELWTIDTTIAAVDGDTILVNNPQLLDQVEATLVQQPDDSWRAVQIRMIAKPEATPEPYEFTGIIETMQNSVWTFAADRTISVFVPWDAQIDGIPAVGSGAKVEATIHPGGEIWAKSIQIISFEPFEFVGLITEVAQDHLVVDGNRLEVTAATQFFGRPEVGRLAEIRAWEEDPNRFVALLIRVLPNTETPTPKPTRTPKVTATPSPGDTPTPSPTETPTPAPTDAATPAPTETPSQEPSPTISPTATATESPVPPAHALAP